MFIDRLPATLVHLRHATTHDVLARWFGVDTSTITRSIAEVRPLLAERGCTVGPGGGGRTPAPGRAKKRGARHAGHKHGPNLRGPWPRPPAPPTPA
ncbi:helix-turn-helix domain-containing protein, partial [Streptomyces sp. NPDC004976]